MAELLGLLAASFLAATLVPLPSEAALYAFLKAHPGQGALAVTVATLGNTAGGMTTYLIGRLFPGTRKLSDTALRRIRRYGAPATFFAWLPIVGDGLSLAAGWLRISWWAVLIFMALGRLLRYIAIAAISIAHAAPARTVDVQCVPALSVFCHNIHVSCAGPTDLRTFQFKLRVASDRGWIEAGRDGADFQQQYANAHIAWDNADGSVILTPRGRPGYIKLLADGRFSFRHYPDDTGGVMSYGRCE
jgi:membrane protein YqaA with SNARE-associated domain